MILDSGWENSPWEQTSESNNDKFNAIRKKIQVISLVVAKSFDIETHRTVITCDLLW